MYSSVHEFSYIPTLIPYFSLVFDLGIELYTQYLSKVKLENELVAFESIVGRVENAAKLAFSSFLRMFLKPACLKIIKKFGDVW